MTQPKWIHILIGSVKENSTTILSSAAIAGVMGTVVLAVKATPRALEEIAQARDDKEYLAAGEEERAIRRDGDPLTIRETIKVTWKLYIPAGITGIATIALIIGTNAIGIRQKAAYAGAYALADAAFREYKENVLKVVGEKKEQQVRDKIAEERVKRNPPDGTIIITGTDVLCYDQLTGRYFKSDHETIRSAENEVNHRILTDMYASHNEFYELIGIGHVVLGEEMGWNIEHMLKLVFSTQLSDNGEPCLSIGYKELPIKDYGKVF